MYKFSRRIVAGLVGDKIAGPCALAVRVVCPPSLTRNLQHEGQAAMELEGLAWQAAGGCPADFQDLVKQRYYIALTEEQGMWTIDFRPMTIYLRPLLPGFDFFLSGPAG